MKLSGATIPGAGVAVAGAGIVFEVVGPEREVKNMWKMSAFGGVETVTPCCLFAYKIG